MKQFLRVMWFCFQWTADKLDKLTSSIALPVLLLLAVFSPTSLRIVVLVAGSIWLASKIIKRLPGASLLLLLIPAIAYAQAWRSWLVL